MTHEYHFDGYTIGNNPSRVGGGFTIKGTDGFFFTHQITRNPILNKQLFTCNEAELLGAVFAASMAPRDIILITDSKNTIAWLNSCNPKARPDLKWLCVLAKQIMDEKDLIIKWQPRNINLAGRYNEFELGV